MFILKDGLLNKIKKLINWKKVILQTYKPKKNVKYIGSTSSSLMKVQANQIHICLTMVQVAT